MLECPAEGKTFKSVSPVRLAKAIDDTIGKLQSVVRQRDGSILVEMNSDKQIEKIRKIKELAGL